MKYLTMDAIAEAVCSDWQDVFIEFAEDYDCLDDDGLPRIPITRDTLAKLFHYTMVSDDFYNGTSGSDAGSLGWDIAQFFLHEDAQPEELWNRWPLRSASAERMIDWLWVQYSRFGFKRRIDELTLTRATSEPAATNQESDTNRPVEPHQVSAPTAGGGQAYIVNDQGEIVVFADGRMHVVPGDHPKLSDITSALYRGDYQKAISLADRHEQIARAFTTTDGEIELTKAPTGEVLLDGLSINQTLADKAISLLDSGLTVDPLLRFIKRLAQNPNSRIREQLLPFLAANDFAIDTKGYIVAWKKVTKRSDGTLTDPWTKTLDYTPPRVVTMPRDAVVDDPDNACAPGLHFATWEFTRAYHSGDQVVELRVDPRDVVSVPHAHTSKGRACTFYIEREISNWEIYPGAPGGHGDGRVWPSAYSTTSEETVERTATPQ